MGTSDAAGAFDNPARDRVRRRDRVEQTARTSIVVRSIAPRDAAKAGWSAAARLDASTSCGAHAPSLRPPPCRRPARCRSESVSSIGSAGGRDSDASAPPPPPSCRRRCRCRLRRDRGARPSSFERRPPAQRRTRSRTSSVRPTFTDDPQTGRPGAPSAAEWRGRRSPCACSALGHRERTIVVAEHDGDDLRDPGGTRDARARRAAHAGRATSASAARGVRARRRRSSRLASSAAATRRRRRGREDERPRALDQVVDRPRRPGDERAADAERLARRVDRHEHVASMPARLDQAAAARRRRRRRRALRRR